MTRSEECTCSWDMMLVMLVSMTCLPMQLAGNQGTTIGWRTRIRGELHAPYPRYLARPKW
jgi:hypothetical protein